MAKIEIMQTDITQLEVDAIVNAANQSLLGGGGVDGAIHRAAGPELRKECETLGGCPTGEAKITRGYQLPAAYVIHTVGPVWHGGDDNEEQLLADCYRHSLELALERDLNSIAFPSISTGAYRFPIERACRIALETTREVLDDQDGSLARVIFACFSESDWDVYKQTARKLDLDV